MSDLSHSRARLHGVPDHVVVDEWTLVVRADAALSRAGVERLRELVNTELAETARRLTGALAPTAIVELT